MLGIFFYTIAKTMNILIGWPVYISMFPVAAVVGVYTLFGGLKAVVNTDAIRCAVLFFGSIIIVLMAFLIVGGWSALVESVTSMGEEYAHHFELTVPVYTPTPYGWDGVLFDLAFVLSPAYLLCN